jgi:hypothetical protein
MNDKISNKWKNGNEMEFGVRNAQQITGYRQAGFAYTTQAGYRRRFPDNSPISTQVLPIQPRVDR